MKIIENMKSRIRIKKRGPVYYGAFIELTPMKIQNKKFYSVIDHIAYPLAGTSMVTSPFSSEVGLYVVLPL